MHYEIQEILNTISDINEGLFDEKESINSPMLVFEGNECYGIIKYFVCNIEIILYNSEWSEVEFNEETNEYEPLKEVLIREFEKEKDKLNRVIIK